MQVNTAHRVWRFYNAAVRIVIALARASGLAYWTDVQAGKRCVGRLRKLPS